MSGRTGPEDRRTAGPRPGRRVGIATRLFVGFGGLAALVVLLAVANLAILERINRVNASILESDVPLLEMADGWIEEVLEQEHYARRAELLGSAEMLAVSREEAREFRAQLARIEGMPDAAWVPRRRLADLHAAYTAALEPGRRGAGGDEAAAVEREVRALQQELVAAIKGVALEARRSQARKAAQTAEIGRRAFQLMGAACLAAVLLSVAATVVLTRGIARPISALRAATERIAAGRFDVTPDLRRGDELGDLSRAFAEMARRLKRLEELYLDASPLTRLPGNIAIENLLRKRLAAGAPLVFCLVDLDNFKAYNDRYGYARGSGLIKATARVIEETVRELGGPEDFVGHIGGDDFVIVTTPERYRDLCGAVISRFDAMVGAHYDAEDLQRRHVVGKDRQGRPMRHPITSVSIAVVTNEEHAIESPIQIGEIAADLKEYAKSLGGGVYVVDRRRREAVHGRGAAVPFPTGS